MKLLKYKQFLNESINRRPILRYLAFDWDDNILMMPTKINLEHLVDNEWVRTPVSTEEFAKVRGTEGWRNVPDSYIEIK